MALIFHLVELNASLQDLADSPFFVLQTMGGTTLHYERNEEPASMADLRELDAAGLIRLVPGNRGFWGLEIRPAAHAFVRDTRAAHPAEHVETDVRGWLDGELFARRHPEAAKAWSDAMGQLASAETLADYDAVGGLCRIALQQFAASLIKEHHVQDADPDVAKTRLRLRTVINHRRAQLGETGSELLEAMLGYWDALIEAVQQLHKATQKRGRPITRNDARRVVFQTGVVMYEIDQALAGSASAE